MSRSEGASILVVDGDDDSRAICASALEMAGWEVTVSSCAIAARRLARRSAFQVVVFDLGFPPRKGIQRLWRFQRAVPGIPVIVTTTCVETSVRGSIEGADCTSLMLKPFFPDHLRDVMQSLLLETGNDGGSAVRRSAAQSDSSAPAPPQSR